MTGLRLRSGSRADSTALAALLEGLSEESAYRRFQASLGPVVPPAVLRALLPEGPHGGAVLAYDGTALVGHGVWSRAGTAAVADIGLVVADAHQGRRIGAAMAGALLADLAARGVEQVEVFSTATNQAVARLVARHAPDAACDRDGPTVTYSFATGKDGGAGAAAA